MVINLKKDGIKKERDFKKCIFPFIMSIITFVIGYWFFYLSKGNPFSLRIKIILIGYLPTIIFITLLLICYFKCKTQKSQQAINVITSILTFFLLVYYIGAIFMSAMLEFMNPITEVKYYKDKINNSLLKVFPIDIPKDVLNVKFIYFPGFLQAGTGLSLYYVDNNMTIEKFDKKYSSKAEWIGYLNNYNEKEGLLNGAFFNTPADDKNEDDYIIYLVDSHCDDSGYCNHGSFLFTSFNEKTKEVIFKSEVW